MFPSGFRDFFKTCLHELGLDNLGMQPYSIRRGGATHDYQLYSDAQRTVLRGRWSDVRTARIYVTDGAATIASMQITPASQTLMQYYSNILIQALT